MSWTLCCALIAEFLVYSKELMFIPAILHGKISTSISYLTKPNIGNGNIILHLLCQLCSGCQSAPVWLGLAIPFPAMSAFNRDKKNYVAYNMQKMHVVIHFYYNFALKNTLPRLHSLHLIHWMCQSVNLWLRILAFAEKKSKIHKWASLNCR